MLNLKNIPECIEGLISGGISLKDFSAVTGCDSDTSLEILVHFLENGIGYKKDGFYHFTDSDKLKAAMLTLRTGADIDSVSNLLDWKNFEGLVAEILIEKDFVTVRNMILTKPRMEIDVIGTKMGVSMLIDCKHWNRASFSSISNSVEKQIQRTKHYVSQNQGIIAVPIIVTLHNEDINFIKNVPIVPIQKFSSFVDDFYGNLDEMNTIK